MASDKTSKGQKMQTVDTAFDPIAAALKQMHESVASEDVPDDFMKILSEIDAKIAADKKSPKTVQ